MKPVEEHDLELIKEYLLLPLLLTLFERDKKAISESGAKIKEPYQDIIEKAMQRVQQELMNIRAEFRKRGIKVVLEEKRETEYYAEYKCRGYLGNFSMLWFYVKAELQVRMRKFLIGN